jgi:4-amino-4-deoxy-L-arabinose transferase-like glycosyltransferase
MFNWGSIRTDRILISLLGAAFFLPFLGQVHLFDWDEINFAEAAREMIVTGKYYTVQINYLPFWQKPPLFIWMQALSMNLFGVGEYGARFPNAICGILTLLTFYEIGRREKSRVFGLYWALAYLASLLPHLYFKSGIIDPWFNYFIFLSVYFFYRYTKEPKGSWMFWSAAVSGLGVMTKGPVALLMLGLTVVSIVLVRRSILIVKIQHALIFMGSLILFGGFWFLEEIVAGRFYIIQEFIDYQIKLLKTEDAGHAGPFFYHPLVILIGCFPISVFAFPKLFRFKGLKERDMGAWMLSLFWLVILMFSIVQTKIVHYSSLAYFPLSYLAADAVSLRVEGKPFPRSVRLGLILVGSILLILFLTLPYLGMNIELLRGLDIRDPFARANLQAEVSWTFTDLLMPFLFLAALLAMLFSKRMGIALLTSALSIALMLLLFVPKIEAYSQRAAIEFFKEQSSEDVYVYPLDYKSYAHLFYSQKRLPQEERHSDIGWILSGNSSLDCLFISKIQHKERFEKAYPQLRVKGEKNGFVFYELKSAN